MTETEFRELAVEIAETQRYISNAEARLHQLITKLQVATVNMCRKQTHFDRLNGESPLD